MAVAAPHREAEEAGAAVLAEGGNAVEAAVAVAAALCSVYPHMTGLGGDGFWLVAEPGRPPVGIRACGSAARAASPAWYRDRDYDRVPTRGGEAALTAAGAVAGWKRALELSASWGGKLPLERLLSDARTLALRGVAVTRSQASLTATKWDELRSLPGFAAAFAPAGPPSGGDLLIQSRLAAVLERLAAAGLDDFYRGDLARSLAADLNKVGSPLTLEDLTSYEAVFVEPLSVDLSVGTVWNLPPPTQGVASLAILALFDRLGISEAEGFDHVHALVEATKRAFAWRDAHVGDPDRAAELAARRGTELDSDRGAELGAAALAAADPRRFLSSANQDALARTIDLGKASPWPQLAASGDTVWFGVVDGEGRAVSCIQSLYWEFGAGVVLEDTGLLWQNRGSSFTMKSGPNQLEGGRLPFHTLNPALARLSDPATGAVRTVAYGTMGGEGQPQTQAAFLTRYAWFGRDLGTALDAPRWLLGRTWGEDTFSLRLESRFDPEVVRSLIEAGHAVEVVGEWDDRMGHAGAVVAHSDGRTEAAHDRRADGGGLLLGDDRAPWELRRFLSDLARFGAEADGGVTRLLYDEAWSRARARLAAEFERMGFSVRGDRVGNLYGRLAGTELGGTGLEGARTGTELPVILTGSHFDTVRHGGAYDGAYGVAAAAVALADLRRRHGPPRKTVEVVAFCEEEGSRFPITYWGSGNLAGRWDTGSVPDPALAAAMEAAGFGRADQADPRRTDLAAFIELHIEQGIVLERSGERIGVVSAIVGQRRLLVGVAGEANHAGTTPMDLRRDALAGAAVMMAAVETEARARGAPLVATVGFVEAVPNTPNVIPGRAAFTVDARHTDERALADFCASLEAAFASIAEERGLTLDIEERMAVEPISMDAAIRSRIAASCEKRNLSYRIMPSGAGHDSQVMASLCPAAMIFVPSRRGVSHSPQEFSSHPALVDGMDVLRDVLYDLAWKGTTP